MYIRSESFPLESTNIFQCLEPDLIMQIGVAETHKSGFALFPHNCILCRITPSLNGFNVLARIKLILLLCVGL